MLVGKNEIPDALIAEWMEMFPGVPVEVELKKADGWLSANPHRPKKRIKRFLFNWLSRSHERLLEVQLREQMRGAKVVHETETGERYRITAEGFREYLSTWPLEGEYGRSKKTV